MNAKGVRVGRGAGRGRGGIERVTESMVHPDTRIPTVREKAQPTGGSGSSDSTIRLYSVIGINSGSGGENQGGREGGMEAVDAGK